MPYTPRQVIFSLLPSALCDAAEVEGTRLTSAKTLAASTGWHQLGRAVRGLVEFAPPFDVNNKQSSRLNLPSSLNSPKCVFAENRQLENDLQRRKGLLVSLFFFPSIYDFCHVRVWILTSPRRCRKHPPNQINHGRGALLCNLCALIREALHWLSLSL